MEIKNMVLSKHELNDAVERYLADRQIVSGVETVEQFADSVGGCVVTFTRPVNVRFGPLPKLTPVPGIVAATVAAS